MAALERTLLSPVTAAALRAALDALLAEQAQRPLIVAGDEAALEIRLTAIDPGALAAAGLMLERIGGQIGPVPDRRGEWLVRVATLGGLRTYLMLDQGGLGIAIPWQHVLRVRMATDALIESLVRQGVPVLAPLVPGASRPGERPIVLVGLGLKRGYLPADRLIWRMPAEPVESSEAGPGWSETVCSADGEQFRVVDVSRLLRDAPAIAIAGSESRSGGAMAQPARDLRPLGPEDIEPLAAADEESTEAPPAPRPLPRIRGRALIAEDSFTARIFLQRLLERRGFSVESVTRADELAERVRSGTWTIVLADVELPDADAPESLRAALDTAPGTPVVALVRDAADERIAAAAGIEHWLRKPFESDALDATLDALHLGDDAS